MGKTLNITLIIILIIILLIAATVAYFYYFHVFKTLTVCISDTSEDTQIPCTSNQECVQSFKENTPDIQQAISTGPEFIQQKLDEIVNQAIFCETTCKARQVRGLEFNEEITCNENETPITLGIRGKEGLELLQYLKQQID